MTKRKFERIVEFLPAYDKRYDPKGNFGISAMKIRFILKGSKGAIQFVIGTDWDLPHIQKDGTRSKIFPEDIRPDGWDVGFHSPKPMYDDQTLVADKCEYLDGKPCYYDGSSCRADDWVRDILLPQGSDGVWKAMEKEYDDIFINKSLSS